MQLTCVDQYRIPVKLQLKFNAVCFVQLQKTFLYG